MHSFQGVVQNYFWKSWQSFFGGVGGGGGGGDCYCMMLLDALEGCSKKTIKNSFFLNTLLLDAKNRET